MRVRRDEGVAIHIHIGPEPCGVICEGVGEASAEPMVHEPEKSDLFTVAVKPANNSEGSEAESVERREGAEGNTIKQRARRTQSRVSVYPGLERVRERARTEKKEQFTAPLHHVDVDLLRTAFS